MRWLVQVTTLVHMNYLGGSTGTAVKGRSALIAAEIRAELARQRGTYTDLADGTGMALPTLRRRIASDAGSGQLTLDELERICDYLGTTPVAIVTAAVGAA